MNSNTLFIINNKKLYMDKILIMYNNVAIYFICKDDDNNKYIVYMPDCMKDTYFIFEPKEEDIYNMLDSIYSMREILLDQPYYYDVTAKDNISEDIVYKRDITEIDPEILPYSCSYFNIVTEEDKKYFNDFKEEFERKVERS